MGSIANHLKQSDIFYQFTPAQIDMVANLCQETSFKAGETIFEENSEGKELYVVAQGEVEILINPQIVGKGESKGLEDSVIATLRKGQSFGEIALVDEGHRSASARAASDDATLLVIQRERLIMLCETYPQLGYRLMYNLAADLAMKMRNTDLRMREELLYNAPKDKN